MSDCVGQCIKGDRANPLTLRHALEADLLGYLNIRRCLLNVVQGQAVTQGGWSLD